MLYLYRSVDVYTAMLPYLPYPTPETLILPLHGVSKSLETLIPSCETLILPLNSVLQILLLNAERLILSLLICITSFDFCMTSRIHTVES
jgi:hypothetical protein